MLHLRTATIRIVNRVERKVIVFVGVQVSGIALVRVIRATVLCIIRVNPVSGGEDTRLRHVV